MSGREKNNSVVETGFLLRFTEWGVCGGKIKRVTQREKGGRKREEALKRKRLLN